MDGVVTQGTRRAVSSRWGAVAVGALALGAAATRFVRLDQAPGEWYGDISTVYEFVLALRNGSAPNGYYALGLGALYPEVIRPVLWVGGDSYLSIKVAGAICSLVGLLILYRFTRHLLGSTFALLTTALAAMSSWWLVFSRLGDVQALTPTLALAAVACAFSAVRDPEHTHWPAAAGALSALGVYLYGNTIVLPIITGALLFVAWRLRRIPARSMLAWGAAVAVVLVPMIRDLVREPRILSEGYDGQRFVRGWAAIPNFFRGVRTALWSYVSEGDRGFRGNPTGFPHIDHISLVFAVIGIAFWLGAPRRRIGLALLGTFALLHLPVLLVSVEQAPSASRTVAAAPFAYIIVAGGIWWSGQLFRRLGAFESLIAMAVIVAGIGAYNIDTYVNAYLPGLPYHNVPIARAIVEYIDTLPADAHVHVVGTGWSDAGMPEFKSIVYAARHPANIVQDDPTTFDCAALAALARPSVLVWRDDTPLPGRGLEACASQLGDVRTVARNGVPVFRTATLR